MEVKWERIKEKEIKVEVVFLYAGTNENRGYSHLGV